jgi:hypothetical protein
MYYRDIQEVGSGEGRGRGYRWGGELEMVVEPYLYSLHNGISTCQVAWLTRAV